MTTIRSNMFPAACAAQSTDSLFDRHRPLGDEGTVNEYSNE
jgi:hypothetical protein